MGRFAAKQAGNHIQAIMSHITQQHVDVSWNTVKLNNMLMK